MPKTGMQPGDRLRRTLVEFIRNPFLSGDRKEVQANEG